MLLTGKTKKLSFCAMLTGISLILLLIAGVVPGGRIGIAALAGLLPAAAVLSCGMGWGVMTWLAVSGLGFLILPVRGVAVVYFLLLGHYPILKSLMERCRSRVLEWALKLVLFYALLCLFFFGFRTLFAEYLAPPFGMTALVFVLGGAAFVMYDIAFSKLIAFYLWRIHPHIK